MALTLASKIKLGLIIILGLFGLSLLFSQKANPDAPLLFGLKRVQENEFLKLKSDPVSRVDYMSSLLDFRLQELKNIVNNQSYDYVLPAASRYSTLMGQITDLVVASNLKDKVDPLKAKFINHQAILDEIYFLYPKNTDNIEWKYIQDDINYLKIYLDKLESL